jgi:TRAP-type C4-dicarboxylate transport system permease small subunit
MPISFTTCFDRAAAFLAASITVVLFVVVMLGIISRAFNDPYIWTDELARFLMAWLAVFGWILASRRRIHVRIRYFQDKLPQSGHRVAEIVIQIALFALGVLTAWFSVLLTARNLDIEATTLPISIAWLYIPMTLAGLVTALQAASEIVEQCRGKSRRDTQQEQAR